MLLATPSRNQLDLRVFLAACPAFSFTSAITIMITSSRTRKGWIWTARNRLSPKRERARDMVTDAVVDGSDISHQVIEVMSDGVLVHRVEVSLST